MSKRSKNRKVPAVSPPASRRVGLIALVFTLGVVLVGAAVAYISYQISRRQMLEHSARGYLALARNVAHSQITREQPRLDIGLKAWEDALLENGSLQPGSYLCFVDSRGVVTIHTANPGMRDKSVGDTELVSLDGSRKTSIGALIREQGEWVGFLQPYWGSTQLGAMVYSQDLQGLVAIHVPFPLVERGIAQSAYPWLTGLALILAGLVPLSSFVVYRAYRGTLERLQTTSNALRHSQSRYRDFFRAAPTPIFLANENGMVIEFNKAAAALFGAFEPRTSLTLSELYRDPGEFKRHLHVLNDLGRLSSDNVAMQTRKGRPLQCALRATLQRTPETGTSYQFIVQDMTRRVRETANRLTAEQRWRYVVDNAPAVILTLDANGVIQTANRGLGANAPEDLPGSQVTDYLIAPHRPRLAQALRQALDSGRTQTLEMTAVGVDDSPAHYSARVGPIPNRRQRDELVLIATDVTRFRIADSQLRRHNLRQRALIDFGLQALKGMDTGQLLREAAQVMHQRLPADYCWVLAPGQDGTEVLASFGWETDPGSQVAFRTISSPREEKPGAQGMPTQRLDHPFLRQHHVKQGWRIPLTDESLGGAVIELFWVEPRRLDASDERFLQMMSTTLVQAARNRRTQDALEVSNVRYRELADALPQTVFESDPTGRLTFLNAAAQRRFGVRPAALQEGFNFLDMLSAEEHERAQRQLEEIRLTRETGSREYLARLGNGERFPAVAHLSPIVKGYECVGFRGILIDLTEVKGLEAQLRRSQKLEAFGRLAGGIAHDFNNILTAVRGYVSLSEQQTGSPLSIRQNLREVEQLCDQGASLVRQLLAFSRRQPCHPVPIDLNRVVEGVLSVLSRVIGEDVELTFEPDRSLTAVQADPGQIEQLLLNLAVNARDAMPTGGALAIATAAVKLDDEETLSQMDASPGWYARLTVADNGTGMDDRTRSQIFEPFFTTKDGARSSGLGLPTVYGIVRQHRGYISAHSELGAGTTFHIYLPVEDLPLPEDAGAPSTDSAPPRGNEQILLVEDEEQVRTLLEKALVQMGYEVLSASDPGEAEELVGGAVREFDLLVSDVVLPGCSGPELYRKLNQMSPNLQVLYLSGYADENVRGLYRIGEAPFIQKPFAVTMLARRVREILDANTA